MVLARTLAIALVLATQPTREPLDALLGEPGVAPR
jgi:hypothetical protein